MSGKGRIIGYAKDRGVHEQATKNEEAFRDFQWMCMWL